MFSVTVCQSSLLVSSEQPSCRITICDQAYGNPARQVGWISRYGHKLVFDNNGNAVCPESQESYSLEDDIVKVKTSLDYEE